MRHRQIPVILLLIALVAPAALGAPREPDNADVYVNEGGDTMAGDLEMQSNAITWGGQRLTSPGGASLTFAGAQVCLATGNCPDADTTYAAGAGLVLAGTTFALIGCDEGAVLKVAAGAWACGADVDTDTDTDTTYDAGGGLSLSGTTFSLMGCSDGQVLKVAAGAWACGADVDTDTDTDTDTLATLTCADGQVPKHAGGWSCGADVDTDTDTLSTLSCGEGAIVRYDGGAWSCSVDQDMLASIACAEGEVLKVAGSAWGCGADADTTYAAGAGLQLSGTTLALAPCAEGQVLQALTDGGWECSTGPGIGWSELAGVPTGFADDVDNDALEGLGCAEGEIAKVAAGAWACGADGGGTEYAAANGISLSGSTFTLAPCPTGQVRKSTSFGAWTCSVDQIDGGNAAQLWGATGAQYLRSDVWETFTGPSLTIGASSVLNVLGPARIGSASGADDDSLYFDDGVSEWMSWRNGLNQFQLSDDLEVQGNVIARASVMQNSTVMRINHDGPDANQYLTFYRGFSGGEYLSWSNLMERFFVSDRLDVGGHLDVRGDGSFDGRQFWLNRNGGDADQMIGFFEDGVAAGEQIRWSDDLDRFDVTDALGVDGYLALSPTGETRSTIYFHDDGSAFAESLYWQDSTDRFEFSDDVRVWGAISSTSTARLKTDIADLEGALTTVLALRGVSYDRIEDGRPEIGLLAEEVVEHVPEVVVLDESGLPAGIDYSRLVALLVEAIEEQQVQVDTLRDQQADILTRLDRLETQGS